MFRKCLAVAVILLFIGVALAPSVNAKMNNEPVPDLDCEGFLAWSGEDLEPGDVLTGSFTVENIGEPNSELDWRIMSCPFWGTWTFDPESGTGLTPEDGFLTIVVELILEVEINETLYGEIGIQNVDNESDICYIDIQIKKKSDDNVNESTANIKTHFSRYLDNLPSDIPPPWFTFFYTLIMLSLNVRILIVTPLAITPTGEYWGYFEINSYFFFFILFTLVFRFAFWYTLFEKIAEKNNWDLP